MEPHAERLTEHAVELVSAACRLADSVADPSTQRQAQLLSSLYEAGATLRLSRRACARANELLVDMTAASDPVAHVHHEPSTALG